MEELPESKSDNIESTISSSVESLSVEPEKLCPSSKLLSSSAGHFDLLVSGILVISGDMDRWTPDVLQKETSMFCRFPSKSVKSISVVLTQL